jgi:hypothetical protein
MTQSTLPCGLYRTGIALPGFEERVPAGSLVQFHNHSDQGVAMVLTPHDNTANRWNFHERGWAADNQEFLESLVALKPEGLYVTSSHLHITREEILPERTLVQLGYNRRADSILFPGRFQDNAIVFPDQGYAFPSPDIQKALEPAGFRVPMPPKSPLH